MRRKLCNEQELIQDINYPPQTAKFWYIGENWTLRSKYFLVGFVSSRIEKNVSMEEKLGKLEAYEENMLSNTV